MIKQSIYKITVEIKLPFVKMAFKWFQRSLAEAYNIVERTVKWNNRTSYHHKTLIVVADDIGLVKY